MEQRELSHTFLKVPVYVGASDFALRGIWKDIELWVLEGISPRYRNCLSTFEAVRQLLNANAPKSIRATKFEVFRQTIQEFITNWYSLRSTVRSLERKLTSICGCVSGFLLGRILCRMPRMKRMLFTGRNSLVIGHGKPQSCQRLRLNAKKIKQTLTQACFIGYSRNDV